MFKKSLVTTAVLTVFAGVSAAAEVELYGVVDLGLKYLNQEAEFDDWKQTTDGFTMDSGVGAASRIGLKGTEDLGNGYTVAIKLENGLNADDGTMGNGDRLFGREASLSVTGPWGTLSAGRMGALGSSAGTYDTVFAIADAFDGGDGDIISLAMTDRYDNMLTYRTPTMAGLQMTAQYSFKLDNKSGGDLQKEGHNSADRYAGLGLTGEFGAFQAVAAYEQVIRSDELAVSADDQKVFSLGGNYDFGVTKVFLMGQYYEGATLASTGLNNLIGNGKISMTDPSVEGWVERLNSLFGLIDAAGHQAEGYSFHLGAQTPLMNGMLTTGLYYSDADGLENTPAVAVDFEEIALSAKYEYPLSARTTLYGELGYSYAEADVSFTDVGKMSTEMDTTQAYIGLTHSF